MKSIPCQSTSFMLSQSFRNGLKSVHRSESRTWPVWGIGKSSRKNIHCTLLVPICSSRKEDYDGILVCNSILPLDRVREHVKQKLCDVTSPVLRDPPRDYSYLCRESTLLSTLCPYRGCRVTGVFQSVPPS